MIENTFGMDIVPGNDAERLVALKRYRIMDTPSEASFDNIAKLCTQIFNVPISLVSLVDADRVFFKSNVGMGRAKEANRGKSLCSLAVLDPEVTVFEDARKEPCLMANPNVSGDFGLQFYAGAPLTTHDGFLIGTLCIIDKNPRSFGEKEKTILVGMARAIMDQIELRISALEEIEKQLWANTQLGDQQEEMQVMNEELTASNEELQASQEHLIALNQNLSNSELRFRNLIKESPVAIAILRGRELIVDNANNAILKIWGKDQSVIGKALQNVLPELRGQPFLELLDTVYLSGKAHYGNEARISTLHNGVMRHHYINFTYQPIAVLGLTQDIMIVANEVTEQVLARKAVEDMNERLQIALDAGKLGSTEVDLANGSMDSNATFKGNFGFKPEEQFNYPDLLNTILPEHHDRVRALVKESIANYDVYQAEYPVRWADGSVHWIRAYGRARYDEHGKANRMVGMTIDITERKLFEERKDDFLSIASHELKTPITSLKASLQMLNKIKEKPFSTMHVKLIDQSNRSMEKMSILVDDLLNMNRMTEGQLKLDSHTFRIAKMLEECCSHVRLQNKHQLIVEGDLELEVTADENRIDQVIVNFVNNAVKYAPDSRDIYLGVERSGNFARISVRDEGPGVAAAIVPHLFDRYYRVSHDSQKYTGLGLGLYICSEIVKRHGGEIGASSELGKGSTFWFTLPL